MQWFIHSECFLQKYPIYWKQFFSKLKTVARPYQTSWYVYENSNTPGQCFLGTDLSQKNSLSNAQPFILVNDREGNKSPMLHFSPYRKDECNDIYGIYLPPYVEKQASQKQESLLIVTDTLAKHSLALTQKLVLEGLKPLYDCQVLTLQELLNTDDIPNCIQTCTQVLSFLQDPMWNHWLYLLNGSNKFFIWQDDGASPLRYQEEGMQHPLLQQINTITTNDNHIYSFWIEKVRLLIRDLKTPHIANTTNHSFDKLLTIVEKQLQAKPHTDWPHTLSHIKNNQPNYTYVLKKWAYHRQSFPQLIQFFDTHPQNSTLENILLYIFTFIPKSHWYQAQQHFFHHKEFLSYAEKEFSRFSKISQQDYLWYWHYGYYKNFTEHGTSIPEIQDKNSLANAYRFIQDKQYAAVINLLGQWYENPPYKKLTHPSIEVLDLLLRPLQFHKIPQDVLHLGLQLLLFEKEQNYGPVLYYKGLLSYLLKDFESLNKLCQSDINPLKSNGAASTLGLILLLENKNNAHYALKLLQKENFDLCKSRPNILQIRALAFLILKELSNFEKHKNYLHERYPQYLKDLKSNFSKWQIQALTAKILNKDCKRWLTIDQLLGYNHQQTMHWFDKIC